MQNVTDTLPQSAAPEAPPTLSRYELMREAGRGGMSVVYEARDRHDGRTVALKVLNVPAGMTPGQAETMLARFTREAHAVAGLAHPNVISIYDTGEENGRHFLVMEFLRGETLRERLGRGPLTPDQAEPILRQVAAALDAVHAQRVIHRDIKPSNVMLMLDGTAKLLDFGVARQSDDPAVTGTGALIGSPAYMSPEQVRGETGTPTSDIWALGTLLYEMLVGGPPFTGKTIPAVLYQVTHEMPAPVPDLPAPIQRVLRRALDKNPARRYPTARALADALHAALPGVQPVPKRRLPFGPSAILLVPILLGLLLVLLSRYQSDAPTVPPAPSIPYVAPALKRHRPRHARLTFHHALRRRRGLPRHDVSGQSFQSAPAGDSPRRTHKKPVRPVSKAFPPPAPHGVIRVRRADRLPVWHRPPPFHRDEPLPRRRQSPFAAYPRSVPRRREKRDGYDSTAASNLENYIYSPESP